eukprot:CAMPEP_0179133262 /NCGR_PEP_ID=MMETSP0796-20121207/63366_1 /TAXON_ID=73915 /ORGANISM="Pyrodinium bahamense, Strain pbaha01" /LENGTH=720 /DNA_ID=CAMNT_0020832221 /DNA_START=20 /DNA_END=2182 /DNA_ORIENTATION=+
MALMSFDNLLERLKEAHQFELQRLWRENDRLNAQVNWLRSQVSTLLPQPLLQDADFAKADEANFPAHCPLQEAARAKPGEACPTGCCTAPPAVCKDPRSNGETAAYLESELEEPEQSPNMTATLWKSVSGIGGSLTRPRRKLARVEIEPKSINFEVLCADRYPDRKWQELSAKQKASLLSAALKPTHYLIHPRSTSVKYWDSVVALALMFVGIVAPYEMVFLSSVDWAVFAVNRVVDLIFILDIVLQFFLKVEIQRPHRGGTIMLKDPVTLRMRYLKSWFFVDVVSVIPFDVLNLVLHKSDGFWQKAKILRGIKMLRLAKLLRVLRTWRILQRWQNAFSMQVSTQKFIKFCMILVLISHWMACLWGLSGLMLGAELCDDQGQLVDFGEAGVGLSAVSWVTALYLGGKASPDSPCNPFQVYVASLHWAVMTITSIGYGDIVPVRVEEYIVGILCMLAGGVLWAYVIGSLCSIISNVSPIEKSFEMSTDLLNIAMDEARVPPKERAKYREYLREAKAYDRMVSFRQVADRFSPKLRKHLMFHVTKEALSSVHYLRDPDAPPAFRMELASNLVPRFFSPRESLDSLRHCLCLLDRGTVVHGSMIMVPPNVFNEDFIVTQKKYQKFERTLSLTYTQVLVLTREEMESVLEPHPQFARKIRRYALKMAFCRAVRMTVVAFDTWKGSMPPGSHMSLSQAFDRACGDGRYALPRFLSPKDTDSQFLH